MSSIKNEENKENNNISNFSPENEAEQSSN